jgi:hypothetical protein
MREMTFGACTPEVFANAVTERGGIILRAAIDKRKIADFKERLEQTLSVCLALTEESITAWDWEKWWPGNDEKFTLQVARSGWVNDTMLREISGGTASFYDLISDPAIHGLIAGGFPGMVFRATSVAVCRRVHVVHETREGKGIGLHCDIRYHRDEPFALNFWTPLDPAGEEFGSAGLEVWPIGFREVMRHLQHDGIQATHISDERMMSIPETYGAPIRTNIDRGDMMVFNSWTPHQTYRPDNLRTDRLSAEVRMVTDRHPQKPEKKRAWWRR